MDLIVAVIIAFLGAAALLTLLGAKLIERAHPPRGRLIEIDGLCQHVVELAGAAETRSDRPPIVLLHGAGANLEDMRLALGEHFSAAGRRVILVDRPGAGWSERRGGNASSPAHQAAVLREVLDRLEVERAVIVGHSWGGTLALTFALDHPHRVAGLVLLAPPTHPVLRSLTRLYMMLGMPVAGWLFARTLALPLSAAAFGFGVRTPFLPQLPPRRYLARSAGFLLLRPAAFLANARDVAGLQKFLAAQVARYATLATPTIIITGDSDAVVSPQRHAMAFAAAAPGARLVVLPGVGHMAHHAAADEVVAAVEQLIADGA